MEIVEEVVIVGAGIAGLATAIGLKRVGIRALVLERAERLRVSGAALSLAPNAWIALEALGISHKLTTLYTPFQRGTVTNVATGVVREMKFPQNNGNKGLRSVHRKVLLEALAEELPANSIRFSSNISAIEVQEQGAASFAVLHLEDGTTIRSKVLIGCDGVHSVVARWLGLSTPIHSGRAGVLALSKYPQGHELKILQQFVDVGRRAAVVPLNDQEAYWFLTGPEVKDMTRNPELIQKQVIEKYAKDLPPIYLDTVRHTDLSTLTWTPLMLRQPWNVIFGNLSKGNVTVAGDAMHPMTPELGQGGCLSLEDAVVLARHIGNSFIKNGRILPEEMAGVLDGYVKERRWRAATLITASYISGWIQQVQYELFASSKQKSLGTVANNQLHRRGTVTNVATGVVREMKFPQNNGNKGLRSVHRKVLLEALAEELPANSIRFSSKISAVEVQEQGAASISVLHLEDGTAVRSKIPYMIPITFLFLSERS